VLLIFAARGRPGRIGKAPQLRLGWQNRAVLLRGRERELARIDELLDGARRGTGGALLLHGEPGIGKTALLAEAGRRGGEDLVLRASGYEASSAIPFGGLRQLVEPLLGLRGRLPPVQALALGVALALEPPSPQARLAVPLALAALIALAAERRAVVALVDDVQWLDPASREAILFAARRLGGVPAALLLAARDSDGAPSLATPGVERLALAPLDAASARELLRTARGALSEPVREAVARAAAGNPLALVELPSGLSPAQRAGRAPLDLPMRLGPLLQASFARQIEELAPQERQAVTVAAAIERGPLSWLLAALARLGLPAGALDAAERTGTVVVADGQIELRHPLLRIAAYYAATEPERRAVHRVLAETAPGAPRRAWHLAAAADAADAGAADALEAVAREARAVGGHAEASAAFERAAELSATDAVRGRRELEAAQDVAIAGDLDRALGLVDAAERHAGPLVRAAVARLRGSVAIRCGDPGRALSELTAEADRQLADGDAAAAARLYLEATVAPMMTGEVGRQVELVRQARLAAAVSGGPEQVLTELIAGETQIAFGQEAEGRAALGAAIARLDEVDAVVFGEIVGMAAQTSIWAGDFDRAEAVVEAMLGACVAAGALGRMAYPLGVRAQLAYRRGRWTEAARDAGDAVQLARQTGEEVMLAATLAWRAAIDAVRGLDAAARAGVEEAAALVGRERAQGIAVHVHSAAALTELMSGRPDRAAQLAREASEVEWELGLRHPAATLWAGELLDGLALAGRAGELRLAVDRLAAQAQRTGSAWAAAVAARGEVTLAPDDAVDARAETALALAGALAMPFEQARTELAVGERLRRSLRRGDARERLASALAGFERLGAVPLAARSRIGLAAPAPPTAVAPLTPQERRIVRLVAEGRTNREIAAALQLGEKTLERRLTTLYRKTGVSSRIELARAAGTRRDDAPA
jgi:DNA-binding CsgD family transcriptional regulator